MSVTAFENIDATQFMALNWFVWTVAFLITALRLYVRYLHLGQFGWDDAFAIFGIISLTSMAILNTESSPAIYKMEALVARASSDTIEQITAAVASQSKMQFAFMMMFWTTLWSIKASLMMLYRRLYTGLSGYMFWWWVVASFYILTYLASVLSNIFACLPLSTRLSLAVAAAGGCNVQDSQNANYFATSVDLASDLFIEILPIHLLIGLRIHMRQKIGVASIFLLGIVIMVFALIRAVKILESIRTRNPTGSISIGLWSMLECSVAVIVGSLPTLNRLLTSKGKGSSYGTGGNKELRSSHCRGPNMVVEEQVKGQHIRLHDMRSPNMTRSTILGGYESDEALNRQGNESAGRITETRVVIVHSHPRKANGSMESFDFELIVGLGK